jgi:hypothetical protein
MFEGPVGDEFAEGRVEPVRAEDILAQQGQAERRFEIGDRVAVFFLNGVGAGHDHRRGLIVHDDGHLVGGRAVLRGIFAVALGPVDAVLEGVGSSDVDEGVEALVHPGVATLVEADDHREPAVADLVRGDPEQLFARVVDAVEDDARIFHPVDAGPATLIALGQG